MTTHTFLNINIFNILFIEHLKCHSKEIMTKCVAKLESDSKLWKKVPGICKGKEIP